MKFFGTPFLLVVLFASSLRAQYSVPRVGLAAGAGTKGVVGVAEVRAVGPVWIQGRFTGSFTLFQTAAGVRVEVISTPDRAVYVQGLIGEAWCYFELSDLQGSCYQPKVHRTGVTFGPGFERNFSPTGRWRFGVEGGIWRGIHNDPISKNLEHWFADAFIKIRLPTTDVAVTQRYDG